VYPVSTETEFREAQSRDFGRVVEGKGPTQTAASVAAAIMRCVGSPRAEVYPYRPARWLAIASVVAPSLGDRLARRFGRRVTPDGGQ
jgi:hypothetical protein